MALHAALRLGQWHSWHAVLHRLCTLHPEQRRTYMHSMPQPAHRVSGLVLGSRACRIWRSMLACSQEEHSATAFLIISPAMVRRVSASSPSYPDLRKQAHVATALQPKMQRAWSYASQAATSHLAPARPPSPVPRSHIMGLMWAVLLSISIRRGAWR